MHGACQKKCPPIFGGPFKHHHNSCTTTCPPIADLGRVSPPGRGSEKRARKGGGAPERAREKIINVYTRCNSANGRVIRNYPILSRELHRRGIYFCTTIRTSFSRCWFSNQAGWIPYSERDDWTLVYSCGVVESRQLVRSIAGGIEFEDEKFPRRSSRLPHYRPRSCSPMHNIAVRNCPARVLQPFVFSIILTN
jgi:hypothetical protein